MTGAAFLAAFSGAVLIAVGGDGFYLCIFFWPVCIALVVITLGSFTLACLICGGRGFAS